MTEILSSFAFARPYSRNRKQESYTITADDVKNDPNGFNYETILVLKEASEGKNLSKKYNSLEEMYKDMGL